MNTTEDNPSGKAPVTIFVLDLLNSKFEDFAYIRYEVRKYLAAQPEHLKSPAELMVLGNESLEMTQGYTANKADLLSALDHLPTALPYKLMSGAFWAERFGQSIDALQQIALQNKGISGRKNIVWVGHGGPGLFTAPLPGTIIADLNRYVHDTTNMLVDARMSLFVIYPGLRVHGADFRISELSADADLGDGDPFSGDINFGVFVNETGGNLFYNRNDIAGEIQESQELGSEYYTLTYQPQAAQANGKFRRIRVTLRDRTLRVVTKAGYFAPEEGAPGDPRQQAIVDIAEAVRSTVPFQALNLTVQNIVRHPDMGWVEFTVVLQTKNVVWRAAENRKSATSVMLAAASLARNQQILASTVERMTVLEDTQDAKRLAETSPQFPVRLRIPHKTRRVRVVVQMAESGRMGAVEIDSKTLEGASEAPSPEQKLIARPREQATPREHSN